MSNIYIKFGEKIEDYEIISILGKGGFATVYKAKCLKTNIDVAIKIIDKKIIQTPGMIERVRQEVSIHSRLKHPSILELYTFFEDGDYVYIVLELAYNGELQKYIKDNNIVITETEASNIIKQVVAGLIYLHSHQILHRDLTLSNLLLSREMVIKIGDFGLAIQLQNPDEKHKTMCGTPNYISPEIASRASHGPPADVWSVGCMLYTLLVGAPPFETDGIKSTLTKIVMTDVKYPAWLSMEAKDLIEQLLRKNPSERIRLDNILSHPFMNKLVKPVLIATNSNAYHHSNDSGFLTMSGSNVSKQSCFTSTPIQLAQKNSPMDYIKENLHKNFNSDNNFLSNVVETTTGSMYKSIPILTSNVNNPSENNYGTWKPFNQIPSGDEQQGLKFQNNNFAEEKLSVGPLNTKRLLPTRHKTKTAIMSILDSGEVVIEFIKFRNRYNEERIVEVCRISSDGLRIVLYQPDGNRGIPVRDIPPDLPSLGVDSIYSYEHLPQKYWKKYMYAARFIQLVKAKTPKITYYSSSAKCMLMETLEDFEMFFYNGGKLVKSPTDGVKIFDCEQETTKQFMMEHFTHTYQHCLNIERTLEQLEFEQNKCFPIIIGKKPKSTVFANVAHIGENTPRTTNFSILSLNAATPNGNTNSKPILSGPQFRTPKLSTSIPDVAQINQQVTGAIEVKYSDGHVLTFTPNKEYLGYTYAGNGLTKQYSYYDEVPLIVKERVSHIPMLLKLLTQNHSNYNNFKLNDNNVKCIR